MEALRLAVGNKEVGYANHSKVLLLDEKTSFLSFCHLWLVALSALELN